MKGKKSSPVGTTMWLPGLEPDDLKAAVAPATSAPQLLEQTIERAPVPPLVLTPPPGMGSSFFKREPEPEFEPEPEPEPEPQPQDNSKVIVLQLEDNDARRARAAQLREARSKEHASTRVPAHNYIKPGAYCLKEGLLAVSEADGLRVIESKFGARAKQRIRGMIEIRDAARRLLHMQYTVEQDSDLRFCQSLLNSAYDRFVRAHGYLHERVNVLAFRSDPDMPLLLSLENFDEQTGETSKADIFVRRTVSAVRSIEYCETPEEALTVSLHERGRVDISFMAALLRKDAEAFVPQMERNGMIFLDPTTDVWETADAYLSGNVRRKLALAQQAGELYARNVVALQAVIPKDLGATEIKARIGSTWIPPADYSAFLNHILECNGCVVEFHAKAGAWNVKIPDAGKESVAATQTFGTKRMAGGELFVISLNQQVPTIKDRNPKTRRYYVNKEETIAIREKQQALKDAFCEWVFADPERSARLVRNYNDQLNARCLREFDGSKLRLPGFSQIYKLHKHQLDAIWRIVISGLNVLLAHVVGAGKTLTMICAGMEMRRLGLVKRPCYVVPNHMLEQFTGDFLRAYPHANVLMVTKDDLVRDKRHKLLSRIASGDWDAVLMTRASFGGIKLSDAGIRRFIDQQIAEIDAALAGLNVKDRSNRIVQELERAKQLWQQRLDDSLARRKRQDALGFEDLGIDFLFVDEAHYFKNLYRLTKMSQIAGLPNEDAECAFDMFLKTRHVVEQHGGYSGVVFATGTPVSNTMAELWTMQRYLQLLTLQETLLGQFDAWAGNFGESVAALELSPDGGGYRMNTRFARFVNIPELMTLFREIADVRTAEMLQLPVPKVHLETVAAKATDDLKAYVAILVERAEAIRGGVVSPREDNMLAVTGDGRKAALDMRMVSPGALPAPQGKVALCAEKVVEIWRRTQNFRGTQIVFCDLGTPNNNGRFSVYHALRTMLIEQGIPAHEIAFIHDYDSDAAKTKLFKSVREGNIRVVVGSTSKLGVGTNIQTRLVALHHLDGPWRPADVEQREGRIVRQGNMNEEVWIYRYVTEGSFDAYMWQILETKARFISQIMSGDTSIRTADDVELAALSYAEVKALASGNPLVMEKAGVDAEVAKLSLLKSQWKRQLSSNRRESVALPGIIASTREWIAAIQADIADRLDVRGNRFAIDIDGKHYTERAAASEVLLGWYNRAVEQTNTKGKWSREQELVVGRFAGFQLFVQLVPEELPTFVLKGRKAYPANHSETAMGLVRVIENAAHIEDALAEANEVLAQQEKRLVDLLRSLDQPFERAARLSELLIRQDEITQALDLDKNAAEVIEADEEEAA